MPSSIPPPKSYEVALARKFQAHTCPTIPLLKLVTRLDSEKDGFISPDNLKTGIRSMWGQTLSSEEIQTIFYRLSLLQNENNRHPIKINYLDFKKYLEQTLHSGDNSLSSKQYGASLTYASGTSSRDNYITYKTTTNINPATPNPKKLAQLRTRLYQILTRHSTSSSTTATFLSIDIDRTNVITPSNFLSYCTKMNLSLTLSQYQALCGNHYKKIGMNLKEFCSFVEWLGHENRGVRNSMCYDPDLLGDCSSEDQENEGNEIIPLSE